MATQTVKEVMTSDPIMLDPDATATEAARAMRDRDMGPVLVGHDGELRGIVTDRDIVVRAIAEGRDPDATKLADLCSERVETIRADEPVDTAARIMREHNIRRVPVVDDGHTVGILSIGDLAMERDPQSALGEISSAKGNR